MLYTVLIRNGQILDGSGNPPFAGDIGILGNRIYHVGALGSLGEKGDLIIDAKNHCVAPGFIDLTNHSDTYGTFFDYPKQESMLLQGVTTIVVGNCGYSLAPIASASALSDLERWTSAQSISIDWSSVSEFYEAVEKRKPGINIATLVGLETLRKSAQKTEERVLLLDKTLEEGAWGLSSNFSFSKNDDENEIGSLLEIVRSRNGLHKVHLRDEGQNLLPAISSIILLARKTKVRTVISHFKAIGKKTWKDFYKGLRMIEQANSEEVPISFDMFPYLRTGSLLLSLLPDWARKGNSEEIINRIQNQETRGQIIYDLRQMTLHPERIIVASAKKDKKYVEKTLKEVSDIVGYPAEETLLELLIANNLSVAILGKTLDSKNMLAAARCAHSIIASDGAGYNRESSESGNLAHPRSFGAFARFIGVVANKANIPLELAIKKITSMPAQALGLRDRGVIAKKSFADIVIFHPETFRDAATYKMPYKYANGILSVIINGKIAFHSGSLSENNYGEALKRK